MSLEEFFNDNSLGENVWDEEEINLDAISSPLTNTTSLDVLKQAPIKLATRGSFGEGHRHPMPSASTPHGAAGGQLRGPPYIVKFSNLPSLFSGREIEDLFQTKCTKFIKFKIFWELNKTPSVGAALKNSNVFDANFTRDSKVAFTELYSARDMDKILMHWTQPLRELYNIHVTMAEFDDFKNYMAKTKLLGESDDPSRPYKPKEAAKIDKRRTNSGSDPSQTKQRRKSNPFGSAKPVDTQSKILTIEQKMSELHIEDTKTLRRVSLGEDEKEVFKDSGAKKPIAVPQPISYSAIIKKSVDSASPNSLSTSPSVPPSVPLSSGLDPNDQVLSNDEDGEEKKDQEKKDSQEENDEDLSTSGHNFTFKETDRRESQNRSRGSSQIDRPSRGGRGGRSDRGGSFRGGRGRGGGRGSYNGKKSDESRPRGKYNNKEDNPYSVFRPASGFLRENINNNGSRGGRGGNHSHNNNNGDRGRGGYRNGRHGFTPV